MDASCSQIFIENPGLCLDYFFKINNVIVIIINIKQAWYFCVTVTDFGAIYKLLTKCHKKHFLIS